MGHEQKSSTNSINKLTEGIESPLDYYDDKEDPDSFPLDEKSINISELEASESGPGDEYSPFDGQSMGSDDGLDLPELNDESYQNMTSEQSSRKDSKATSITTDEALENKDNRMVESDGSDISDIDDDKELRPPGYVDRDSFDYLIGDYRSSRKSPARRTPHSGFGDEDDEFADELQEMPGELPQRIVPRVSVCHYCNHGQGINFVFIYIVPFLSQDVRQISLESIMRKIYTSKK